MNFGAVAVVLASTHELVHVLCEKKVEQQFLQDMTVVDTYMWKVTAFNGWHIKGNVDTFYTHMVNLISAYVCIARDKIRIDVARANATLLRDEDSMLLLPELFKRSDWIERKLDGAFESSEIIEELRNINTVYHWDIVDGEWSKKSHDTKNDDDTIADMHVRRVVWVWRRHPEMTLPCVNSLLFSSYVC
jgi:hypothetical protein